MQSSKHTHSIKLSSVAVAVISMNAALISNHALAEDTTTEELSLPELIVTGEKIDKDIKDTTTAITVIDGETYANGAAKEVNDVVIQAPNVTTSGFGAINIRGIDGAGPAVGSNAFMTGGNARITTSVDGVSEAWGGYNFTPSGLWDTQAVEVLRGPQSTSQGTNAIGGALVVKTHDPSFISEQAIRLGVEQYANSNQKYSLAGMSSGALVDDELAYRLTFDASKGEGWINYINDDAYDADLNDSESNNFRAKLLWTPSDITGLSAKLTIAHKEYDGEYLSWVSDDSDSATLDLSSDNTRLQDSTADTIAFDIDYQISNEIKNSFQISYNNQEAYFFEYSSDDTTLDRTEATTTIENRLFLTPENSAFTSLIGVYATQSDSTIDVDFNWYDNAYLGEGTKTTLALYGETTYEVTDKASVSIGGRIHNENQDRELGVYSGQSYGGDLDEDTSDTVFLPKVSVVYDITKETTLGGSISRGYNSGGAALNWDDKTYYTYDKEEVTAFELSSKTRFKDWSLNANAFFNDYSDYQGYTTDTLENVKSVYTYGAELEVTSLITSNFEARASIGTLQSKIKDTDADTSSWKDNEITYAPDLNLGLGFTQFIGENWSFGADVTYVGEYYSDLDNTDSLKAGNYTLFDANAQYINGNLTIDGYIKNLTNQDAIYYDSGDTSIVSQTRTIGVSATYRM